MIRMGYARKRIRREEGGPLDKTSKAWNFHFTDELSILEYYHAGISLTLGWNVHALNDEISEAY